MKDKNLKICWICGAPGNSGEHIIKSSDIKKYIPDMTQKKPAYYHTYYHNNNKTNTPLSSRKTKSLHFKRKICQKCNNEITQPYDKAWEKMSNYLYEHRNIIKERKYIDLKEVFINDSVIQANNLQLFFIKELGCLLWECDLKDNTQLCTSFSKSLLSGNSRDDVYLKFKITNEDRYLSVISLPKDDEYKYINIELAIYRYILP